MKIAEALEIFSQTHPGMVRSHNEDSVACEPACGLVVLADGMGGTMRARWRAALLFRWS